jgi:hypothetical protein
MGTRSQQAGQKAKADTAGVSATAVRDFLLQSAETPRWSLAHLQKTLAVNTQTARGVLTALSAVGYIEPDPEDPRHWRNTAAGNAMAGVSKARPIKRKTAEKALTEFLNRVREVNLEPGYLYSVDRVVVFGPYVSGGENIKNVDVGLELRPKVPDKRKLEERVKADAERAESEGKRFKSFADRRAWGINKVKQHLRGRGRTIALYDLNESILQQPHQVVSTR